MKITLLGTGSPEPSTRRASSGYLVEIGEDTILLDCGGGVFDRLLQAGYKPSDVTHLFFTHLHSDHMMDYARLVHAAWDEGGAPVKVFGPPPVANITEKFFGRDGVFASDLIARTEHVGSQEVWIARGGSLPRAWPAPVITEISAGFVYHSESVPGQTDKPKTDWCLKTCEVFHAQPQLDCMGFRIESDNKSFVYSGDAALCEEFEKFANSCDLLLHWCYRNIDDQSMPSVTDLSPDAVQIAQLASRCGAGRLLVTHLRCKMDNETTHSDIKNALAKNFIGESDIAEDLMQINL